MKASLVFGRLMACVTAFYKRIDYLTCQCSVFFNFFFTFIPPGQFKSLALLKPVRWKEPMMFPVDPFMSGDRASSRNPLNGTESSNETRVTIGQKTVKWISGFDSESKLRGIPLMHGWFMSGCWIDSAYSRNGGGLDWAGNLCPGTIEVQSAEGAPSINIRIDLFKKLHT